MVRTGGGVTTNASAVDVPPPGDGVNTEICAVPRLARSVAGIATCSCVALTNVVGRVLPFHRTTEVLTNRAPFTVSVNAGPLTTAADGDNCVMDGAGLIEGS